MGERRAYREDSYESDWNRAVNGTSGAASNRNRSAGYAPGAYRAQGAYGYAPQPMPDVRDPSVHAAQPQPARRGRRTVGGCYTFLSWVALFAWAGFIFYMSAHTSSQLGQGVFAHVREIIQQLVWTYYGYVEDPVSPIGHFCEYFIFGALLGNALHCHMPLLPATLLAIACASGYGYTDEIHQLYVDGRYFDLEDWKVDTIAAALGSFLASTVFYLFARRPGE